MSLGREVLIIKIKLERGFSDILSVRERDEPVSIAVRFCRKHNLPQKAVRAITYMIDKNLDALVEEELGAQGSKRKGSGNLYEKGLTQKARLAEKLNSMRSSIDAEQEKLMTFKPALCKQSLNLIKNTEKTTKAYTNRVIKYDTPKNFTSELNEIISARNISAAEPTKTPSSLNKPSNLIHCHSFSFQPRPLSIYQNFKDYSNNKLKTLLRN